MNRLRSGAWLVFIVTCLIALVWAWYSDQAWEDYYITFRASKNLAEGRGLVFTEGERVHSFTSPLGVLLPAASWLATGRSSELAALWLFRVASIAALAGAVVLAWRTVRPLAAIRASAVLLVVMLCADNKTVSFTINGMETGFLLLFAAWALWALVLRPERWWLHAGLAWAGLMWTRPDSCVYIGAMAVGAVLFPLPTPVSTPWAVTLRTAAKGLIAAAVLCAVLYLPWFVWAKWYYGSPVPHTIVAKGLFRETGLAHLLGEVLRFPSLIAADRSSLSSAYLPAYGLPSSGGPGDWPNLIPAIAWAFAFVPLVVWLLPFVRREARFVSFVYFVGHLYLTVVVGIPAPWYLPLVDWLGIVTWVLCLDQALGFSQRLLQLTPPVRAARGFVRTIWALAAVIVAGQVVLTVAMCRQARMEMKISEEQVRRPIGEWLRAHAKTPADTVFLEPLGFIGYFSNLKMLDYPGLGSPEVVAARKQVRMRNYLESWPELVRRLEPDWLVLRPIEERYFAEHDLPILREKYRLVKQFDATAAANSAGWIPIPHFVAYNTRFSIYRRWTPDMNFATAGFGEVWRLSLADFTRKEAFADVNMAEDGRIATHAPARLTLPVAKTARYLSGKFGIQDGAYAKAPNVTDGVDFRVEAIDAAGVRMVIFTRWLDPVAKRNDRDTQEFSAELPAGTVTLEFVAGPGPQNQPSYDWAYWQELMLAGERR